MPIYEYACSSCGNHFEARQSFEDKPIAIHAEHETGQGTFGCFGDVERVIARSSFALHGSGWAKDGYSGKKTQ